MTELENLYGVIGGRFITPAAEIQEKLQGIKAYVFDWDGVFNDGQKDSTRGSNFSEVDSMGTNLLRFSHYLKHGSLPLTAVISGEKNETAFYFCKRECLNYSFFKVAHKLEALEFLCKKENLLPSQIAYVFDDVLDLPIAERCGLRFLVNQGSNPLFANYCIKNKLVDYLTASRGGQFAIRESAELMIGLQGNFDAVITGRKDNVEDYKHYIEKRRAVVTQFFTLQPNGIEPADIS